mgnify:CR=1 FL=1
MARVTVEDCVDKIPNRFDLVLLAAQRAARHLAELVDAGAVRERRQHQGGVGLGDAREEVGQVVGELAGLTDEVRHRATLALQDPHQRVGEGVDVLGLQGGEQRSEAVEQGGEVDGVGGELLVRSARRRQW